MIPLIIRVPARACWGQSCLLARDRASRSRQLAARLRKKPSTSSGRLAPAGRGGSGSGGQSESLDSRAPARCSRHHVGNGAPGRDRPGPLLRPLPRASFASGGRPVPEPAPAARSSLAPCLLAWRWSESNQQSESGSSHVLEPVCKFATFVLGSVRVVYEND